jgi:4-amino-4-deoxy-L-arabinose transferase-like glycosyltransferase
MGISIIPDDSDAYECHRQLRIAGMPISAIAFLILSAVIALIRSHYHLLWVDEFATATTGSIAGISQLIHVELTKPYSFDPIGYTGLMHAVIHVFGVRAFAMRLPSMCGYLLMQVCLFYFVRRISSERAATFALGLPALAGIVSYSIQARPYGLLLGLSALAMLSWQTAARRDTRRTLALIILSLSVAMAVNTQYYGVLLFVPLCAAESIRVLERRRVDVPVLVSIFAGMGGLIVAMPFAKALSQYSANHQPTEVNYHFITHSYLWLMFGYDAVSVHMQRLICFGIALFLISLIAGFAGLRSRVALSSPWCKSEINKSVDEGDCK